MTEESITDNEQEALRQIRNYFVHNGKFPSMRILAEIMGYKSPRSVAILILKLLTKGYLRQENNKYQLVEEPENVINAKTIDVPFIGMVAAGTPILAEQNFEGMIPVSQKLLTPGNKYFILKAIGDSMDQAGIKDGDFVLIKQRAIANEGELVVALIDNEATVKEFHCSKDFVVLKPRSSNPVHKPIILTSDFQIQGVVVTTIPKF